MEVRLQSKYNYKVDRQLYKNVINNNNMKINVTEATTTFPVPANKLRGNLMDMIGLKWETHLGEFELTVDKIPWILKNIWYQCLIIIDAICIIKGFMKSL